MEKKAWVGPRMTWPPTVHRGAWEANPASRKRMGWELWDGHDDPVPYGPSPRTFRRGHTEQGGTSHLVPAWKGGGRWSGSPCKSSHGPDRRFESRCKRKD
eukprot:scaffold2636_cov340-Pavlova_lutheri.AAC.45